MNRIVEEPSRVLRGSGIGGWDDAALESDPSIDDGSQGPDATTPPDRGGPAALLFATMFPQAALSMLSLAPPVMATAVTQSYGLPAEIAGAYSGLVYAFVLLGNPLAPPLIQRCGPLRLSFACVAGGALGLVIFA